MLTPNQLKTILIDFFENHSQVNTVIYADDFDFAAYPDIIYRVVNIQQVDATVKGKELVTRFKIIIGDMEDPDNMDSENEIWNDCLLIADDFLTYFGDDDYPDFLMDTDCVINNFSEQNTDRTAGVRFVVSIRQTREINVCTVPLTTNLTPNITVNLTVSGFDDEFDVEFI